MDRITVSHGMNKNHVQVEVKKNVLESVVITMSPDEADLLAMDLLMYAASCKGESDADTDE